MLFVDDDVLVSPYAPVLFETIPCDRFGAVVEAYHKQGWHAMHGRATCELYDLGAAVPGACSKAATRRMRIFNSGAAGWPHAAAWEPAEP